VELCTQKIYVVNYDHVIKLIFMYIKIHVNTLLDIEQVEILRR